MKLTPVNTMQPTDPVNDALRLLREEQPTPLMSEPDVTRLITSTPAAMVKESGKVPYTGFVVGALILTGMVAVLMLWPTADVPKAVVTPQADATLPSEEPAQKTVVTPPLPLTPPMEADANETQTITEETPTITPFRPTRTLKLTTADLAALGLKFTGDALRYVEDGVSITVRTNGISAQGRRIPSDLRTPRHITLYRKGLNLARWIDATASDIDVNSLIGVQVWLQDSTMPMFREADVILWYAPTTDVIAALPVNKLQQLQRDANTDHRTSSASIGTLVVAPNPVRASSAMLMLDVRTACVSTIRVIDMMGRDAIIPLNDSYSLNVGRESIALNSLQDLPNGMYHVVVDIPATQERLVHRLLIER